MDKYQAKQAADSVVSVLKEKFPKYLIQLTGGHFSGSTLSLKLDITVPNTQGEVESKEVTNFKKYAEDYGLSKSDLGQTFIFKGDLYKISGLLPNKRTFPILAVREYDNARFTFKSNHVKEMLLK